MGFFSDTKQTDTTSSQTGQSSFGLTPQIKDYAGNVISQYNPTNFSNAYVGPNQYQTGAATTAANLVPQLGGAYTQAMSFGATGLDPSKIAQYQSPYTQQVIDATRADFGVQNARQNAGVNANAAKLGAISGTQPLVSRQLATESQNRQQNPIIANLRNQGFNTAADLAKTSAGLQLSGVGAAGNLAGTQGQLNQGLYNIGSGLQQTQQYGQLLPYQLTTQGAQTIGGLTPYSGQNTSGTATGTTTQTATPSMFSIGSNLAGLAISAFSDERLKENIAPVGETFDGQPIYRYNYKGSPQTQIGLIAQDVEHDVPEAVGVRDGYRTVDYDLATRGAAHEFNKARSSALDMPFVTASPGDRMSAGGKVGLEPFEKPSHDPHERLMTAFSTIKGMLTRANGGSVMEPYQPQGYARGGWTGSDPVWNGLTPYQKAAAMALMEADRRNPNDARNALGAMINRATKSGEDLGAHVSKPIYQPTIEPSQRARLGSIIRSPEFGDMTQWAIDRSAGTIPDPVNGATHFLAPERTMLALESREPNKYRSWRSWTGFDPATSSYRGVITRDGSHAFLAPEGLYEGSGPVAAMPAGMDPSTNAPSVPQLSAATVANAGAAPGSRSGLEPMAGSADLAAESAKPDKYKELADGLMKIGRGSDQSNSMGPDPLAAQQMALATMLKGFGAPRASMADGGVAETGWATSFAPEEAPGTDWKKLGTAVNDFNKKNQQGQSSDGTGQALAGQQQALSQTLGSISGMPRGFADGGMPLPPGSIRVEDSPSAYFDRPERVEFPVDFPSERSAPEMTSGAANDTLMHRFDRPSRVSFDDRTLDPLPVREIATPPSAGSMPYSAPITTGSHVATGSGLPQSPASRKDAPSSGWSWKPQGIWAGEQATPLQRLGTALMSVSSPTMAGPTNGIAQNIMAWEKARQDQAHIDANVASMLGTINGQPTLAGRQEARAEQNAPLARRLTEAQIKKAEMDADKTYPSQLRREEAEAKALAVKEAESAGIRSKLEMLDEMQKKHPQFFGGQGAPSGGPVGGAAPAQPNRRLQFVPQPAPNQTPIPLAGSEPVAPVATPHATALPAPETSVSRVARERDVARERVAERSRVNAAERDRRAGQTAIETFNADMNAARKTGDLGTFLRLYRDQYAAGTLQPEQQHLYETMLREMQ